MKLLVIWYKQLPKWVRFTAFYGGFILWFPLVMLLTMIAYPFWCAGTMVRDAWRNFDDE